MLPISKLSSFVEIVNPDHTRLYNYETLCSRFFCIERQAHRPRIHIFTYQYPVFLISSFQFHFSKQTKCQSKMPFIVIRANLLICSSIRIRDRSRAPAPLNQHGLWHYFLFHVPLPLVFRIMRNIYLSLLLVPSCAALFGFIGREQSVAVTGQLICNGVPMSGVKVKLFDKELSTIQLPLRSDYLILTTRSPMLQFQP